METEHKTPQWPYLLLAVVMAAAIWFYVDSYGNNGGAFYARQKITDIPIEYIGASGLAGRGLMLVEGDGSETSETIDLTYEGARLLVTQLDRSKIRVTADLSGITEAGVQTVNYSVSFLDSATHRPSLPVTTKFSKVTRVLQSIDRATVHVGELLRKEVDVRCEVVGKVADGYQAGEMRLSRETMEVQGVEEALAEVSYAKATLNLGEGAEETVSEILTCQFYNDSGEPVDTSGLYITANQVQATLPVYVTKELKLNISYVEAAGARVRNTNRSLQPESVTVTGEASSLRDVTSITLGEVRLIDLIGADNTVYNYAIEIPKGGENKSGVSRATLQISFKDLISSVVTTNRFAVNSDTELPEGKRVEILTESLDVSIFGKTADVEAVKGSDILATPVLGDYTGAIGTLMVPAKIKILAAGDVGVAGEYQLQVRIQEASEQGQEAGT